jgi:phage gp29-like protein
MANYVQLPSGVVIREAEFAERLGKKPSFEEIATSNDGRDITRGYIPQDMLLANGDTVLSTRGNGDFAIYDDIARDDQVKTCRQQRELALIGKEWVVDAADSSRRAKLAADRLRGVLERIEWDDKTRKMLSAVLYGYAVAEVLWATDGAEITIDSIKVRNRSRFGFLPSGELRMRTFANQMSGEALPAGKFWAFACGADHDDEPHGLGLGHTLYWPVFFKKNGIKFWLTFLEKFGQPTALGKYGPSSSDAEKRKLLEALRAIQTDSAIRIPDTMQVELLEAARSGTADYTALVDRMNASISKVYIGHSGAADSTPGKLGGEDNAGEVREDLIKADADLVCGSFNATVAKSLTWYNDPTAPVPKVWRRVEPDEDLKSRAERDKVIFDMGYRPTLKYVTETYDGKYEPVPAGNTNTTAANGGAIVDTGQGSPQRAGVNAQAAMPGNAAAPGDKPAPNAQFADPSASDPNADPTPVTDYTDQLAQQAADPMRAWLDKLRTLIDRAIANGDTLEKLRDDLLQAYGDLQSEELSKVMAMAFATAELAGRFEVQNNA